MSGLLWTAWAIVTLLFNAINSANSRAKNSRSLGFNAATTFGAAALYLTSMLGVGNLLMEARHEALVFAVIAYAALSTLGSVIGQRWSLKFESSHHIQH